MSCQVQAHFPLHAWNGDPPKSTRGAATKQTFQIMSVNVLEHGKWLPNTVDDCPRPVDTVSGILKMISLHIGLVAESGDLVAEWQKADRCRMRRSRA
jgi:hypothetical protein